jgi:transcriptional regulator with XRE-family HTH domain
MGSYLTGDGSLFNTYGITIDQKRIRTARAMTADQLRAARALLRWSQQVLAGASTVSAPTIKRLEAMDGELSGHTATIRALEDALEAAGVVFIPENGGGAGVRLARGSER